MSIVKSSNRADDEVVVQDNDLYPSHNQDASFDVEADLRDNKGDCSKFKFDGMYNLLLDANSISLLNRGTDNKCAVWSYYCIRSYGHSDHSVSFEVGRQCSTGEGRFSFLTADGENILNIIKRQTERMREQNKQDNPNHSQSDASQASNFKTSSSTPTATSNPPVFPKNKLSLTSSNASTRSIDASESNLGCPNPDKTKRKPAPLAPFPSASGGGVLSKQNSNGLDESLVHSSPSSPAISLDSTSSTSNSSKTDKKKLKAQEKERKKKDKKEEKERERKRKAKQRDEKKAMEKRQQGKKKGESSNSTISSSQECSHDDDCIYSEANDHFMMSNRATSKPPQVESQSEYTYIEGLEVNGEKNTEGVYAEPWKDFRFSPVFNTLNPTPPGDVNASPQKKSNTTQHKHSNNSDDYEDIDLQNPVPPAIPSRARIDGDASNNDVYAHFHNPGEISEPTENVYGMGSASDPLLSYEAKINTVDTDVHETF